MHKKVKKYLGIDPGKLGAFSVLDENSEILQLIPMPLIGNEYDKNEIRQILKSSEYSRIGLENPSLIHGAGKSQVVSLQKCVSLIEGIMVGLELPYIMVQPKEWQKECWTHIKKQTKPDGKTDTKATSILAAVNLWSKTDFKITNKGGKSIKYNDGMVDASLIAEYVRRKF